MRFTGTFLTDLCVLQESCVWGGPKVHRGEDREERKGRSPQSEKTGAGGGKAEAINGSQTSRHFVQTQGGSQEGNS